MSNANDALLALAEQNIAELQAENAKLREECELVGTAGYLLAMKQLKAENAKLRDDLETQREAAWHNTIRNAREYKRVRDENDKLRKLASILCFCMQIHKQCDDCKLNGAKGEIAHGPLLACDGLHEMLRELEIEVPE